MEKTRREPSTAYPPAPQQNPGDAIENIHVGWGQSGQDYNFGELLPASLAGLVHTDLNGDCFLQPNERPLAGVTVDLLDAAGNVVATQQTDQQGRFVFTGLAPGSYELVQHDVEGYFPGGQRAGTGGGDASEQDRISAISIASGDQFVDYAFCELPPSEISGFVYQDGPPIQLAVNQELTDDLLAERDGILTPDDQRLAGVVVELRGFLGEEIRGDSPLVLPGYYDPDLPVTTTTDANGFYHFAGLQKFTYSVYEIQPDGYIDGLDHAGSVPAIAVNDASQFFIAGQVDDFEKDPTHDAIVMIALEPGVHAEHNNFSELLVEEPNIDPPSRLRIPFPQPEPAPIPDPITIQWQPFELAARNVEPLTHRLTPYGRSAKAIAQTWHLSVLDAGHPRGEGFVVPDRGPVWFDSDTQYIVSWGEGRNDRLYWGMFVDGQLNRERWFGMEGGIPLTGDFNGDGLTEVAVFFQGQWFVDINGNGRWDGDDLWAKLGHRDDQPVVGDWDGDGKDDIGIFGKAWPGDHRALATEPGVPDVANTFRARPKNVPPSPDEAAQGSRDVRVNATAQTRSDLIDHVFHFGTFGDVAVTGDWNGDGIDNIGIYNDGLWHLDIDGDGHFTDVDKEAEFGRAGDIPLVGDFDGNGVSEIAIIRNGQLIIDSNGNLRVDDQDRRLPLPHAKHGRVVVGDWNGDGLDDVGVVRDAMRFVEIDGRTL